MTFYVKKFTIALLSVIFVALIAGSIQTISADHLEPGEGIYASHGLVNLVDTKDTKYQVYLHVVTRTGDGQLINVTENMMDAAYIPHKITDYVFDTLMGKKEIITIDSIKYEKVQYIFSPSIEHRFVGLYPIFSEISLEFEIDKDAIAKMYSTTKDYAMWKIHHCADYKGHGYDCIPIFQVLVPNMTVEPNDVVTQYWTILRELN